MFAAQFMKYAWLDSLTEFWSQIWKAIREISVFDILDIVIVAFLLYKLIGLVRETRASQLVKGLILLIVVSLVARVLKLRVLDYILTNVLSYGVLAMIVVFQPELRRLLEQVGRSKVAKLGIFSGSQLDERNSEQYKRTVQIVRRDGEKRGVVFNAFDIVDYNVFLNHDCATPYYLRRQELEARTMWRRQQREARTMWQEQPVRQRRLISPVLWKKWYPV